MTDYERLGRVQNIGLRITITWSSKEQAHKETDAIVDFMCGLSHRAHKAGGWCIPGAAEGYFYKDPTRKAFFVFVEKAWRRRKKAKVRR